MSRQTRKKWFLRLEVAPWVGGEETEGMGTEEVVGCFEVDLA